MSIAGRIARGKKWTKLAGLSNHAKNNIEADAEIMKDVNFYKESLEVPAETDVDWSSKNKSELNAACEVAGIDVTGKETKDDIIVLLETNSDKEA